MNAIKHLQGIGEFTNPYLSHFVEKVKVSKRRVKVKSNGHNSKRTHWINRTGTFKDEELRKGPKYWYGQKSVKSNNPIRSYQNLATAIKLIASGDKRYDDYKGVSGISKDRLRLAQSWKDKEMNYDVSDIICLNRSNIKEKFRPGKFGFSRAYL